jgi:four helix bundle protein
MNEFRFLDWEVYKKAKTITKDIYFVTNKFQSQLKHDLGSQINRSAASIALNIAEGSGRNSDRELNRFFDIAIGSAYETIASLDIALEINSISQKEFLELSERCKDIARQLGSFKRKLKK